MEFIAAPVTAYRTDESVDLEVIPSYARLLHHNGVSGVFVNGTTGEGLSLTVAERRATAERWVAAAPAGFRVIVHVGHTCQQVSCELAAHAAEIKADAVGEIGPVFYRPSTVESLADYLAVTAAAAPGLPYYYYHMPSMNQIAFPMVDLLERVDGIPNFAGIKYTFEDLDDYERCLRFAGGRYDILFGRDELLLEALRRGAQGAVGSTYSFLAPLYHALTRALEAGDEARAEQLQVIAVAGIQLLAETGAFFSAAKAVLQAIGLEIATTVRRPLARLPEDAAASLCAKLREAGVENYFNASQ